MPALRVGRRCCTAQRLASRKVAKKRDKPRVWDLFRPCHLVENPLHSVAAPEAILKLHHYPLHLKAKGVPIMNKNDLISAVADSSGLTRSDATKAVEGVFEAITGSLKKGDEVRLVGFGTFSVAKRKASTGRNPRTGEPMEIKASSQPKFKAGKGLKDAVN
ncbi:HU family DNA-binding protein [Novosphingobium sp. P6W]|uniref:HU family DNA-binding protein n=1 Tax=Novosphingobium sp. P6W TaxID=1609758 RepID=UPI002105F6AD|nr:HU family DNA-binding protein [Novosphingobium sp. P6W]